MLYSILSIFVAVGANIIIGILWYSPIMLGKPYMKAKNLKKEDLSRQKKGVPISIISAIIFSIVLKIFISMPRITSIQLTLWVCFLIWLGFILTTQLLEIAWMDKKVKIFLIDVLHQLFSISVMGSILFLFK